MKRFLLYIAFAIIVSSCGNDSKYEQIGQEIYDGKVSAIQPGHVGRISRKPVIWIQTPMWTQSVEIPLEYESRWKVGDSCLLIVQKYKEVAEE